jgi:hypothetical protein
LNKPHITHYLSFDHASHQTYICALARNHPPNRSAGAPAAPQMPLPRTGSPGATLLQCLAHARLSNIHILFSKKKVRKLAPADWTHAVSSTKTYPFSFLCALIGCFADTYEFRATYSPARSPDALGTFFMPANTLAIRTLALAQQYHHSSFLQNAQKTINSTFLWKASTPHDFLENKPQYNKCSLNFDAKEQWHSAPCVP